MKRFTFLLALSIFFWSCKTSQTLNHQTSVTNIDDSTVEQPFYQASNTLSNDILHHKLNVRFDFEKKYLYGNATLRIKPYFNPVSTLILNARGMELKEVSMIKNNSRFNLNYTYNNDSILIALDRAYKRNEVYEIYIDYIAKPDELKEGGSNAIVSDKGLYFINPSGIQKNKPTQIWTQGETQSNSVWFPTIDSPNERLTQELSITIDTAYTSLSNGLLISQVNNNDGTRTDYWKQNVSAAPYLTMMAIGKYHIEKDLWRTLNVDYYVEPEYAVYAKNIFGNTPEMMEFFSNILGVPYTWEKFSQVVVRDYVSGAMENATAVIFGEFMHQSDRERLDGDFEDVISHELFHHWFGDLVTCESWSNIPLNEAFATYGEYLWNEHKYGRAHADYNLNNNLNQYLSGAKQKQVPLIRYHYDSREDMFDVFSYQKGGHVLHMLRKYTGDDVFFAALNLYLETNKFKTVEIHQLRLAFEEISGEDLNWFFDQWFLREGHPELTIEHSYDEANKEIVVHCKQEQTKDWPTYRLPIDIDVYKDGNKVRHRIVFSERDQRIRLSQASHPDLVLIDAERMLLGDINIKYNKEEWKNMLRFSSLFLDKYDAVQKIKKSYSQDEEAGNLIYNALSDSYSQIRKQAVVASSKWASSMGDKLKSTLNRMAIGDDKAWVRTAALKQLKESFNDSSLINIAKQCIYDSSYTVSGTAIEIVFDIDEEEGLRIANEFEQLNDKAYDPVLAGIFSNKDIEGKMNFFATALERNNGFSIFGLTQSLNKYVLSDLINRPAEAMPILEKVAEHAEPWFLKIPAAQGLISIKNNMQEKLTMQQSKTEFLLENDTLKKNIDLYALLLKRLAEKESNERVKKVYEAAN